MERLALALAATCVAIVLGENGESAVIKREDSDNAVGESVNRKRMGEYDKSVQRGSAEIVTEGVKCSK